MSADLEISQSGFRTSYVRFLADSAPGYATLALIAYGIREDLVLLPATSTLGAGLLLAAIVIGPPIGLFVNAVGWFLPLGFIHTWVGKRFIQAKWLRYVSGPTKAFVDIGLLQQRAREEGKSIVEWGHHADVLLQVHHSKAYASISHVYGLKQMTRSLSMILPVAILMVCGSDGLLIPAAILTGGFVLFVAGCLDGYLHLRALSLLIAIEAGPKATRLNDIGGKEATDVAREGA